MQRLNAIWSFSMNSHIKIFICLASIITGMYNQRTPILTACSYGFSVSQVSNVAIWSLCFSTSSAKCNILLTFQNSVSDHASNHVIRQPIILTFLRLKSIIWNPNSENWCYLLWRNILAWASRYNLSLCMPMAEGTYWKFWTLPKQD